ncbi:hypothetical protein EJ110_NYTH36418 [Nymphaea thermarum]|nr:hypothetical protein EJ110_NYTH36418 [Nymphaea thermarum]
MAAADGFRKVEKRFAAKMRWACGFYASSDRKMREHPRKLHRPAKRHSREERPDMVSVLVEAIDYVKLLQSEVRAMMMRNSLQHGASTVGLQFLQHPHFPVGPLEVPMALGTNQRMYFGHGSPGMGCYSSVPPLHSSTAHHYISGAATLPWLHQLPTFPMHVTQLRHPPNYLQQAGPLPPCECCFMLADARTWSCPVYSLVPDQEAEALQEESVTTMTSASTGTLSSALPSLFVT